MPTINDNKQSALASGEASRRANIVKARRNNIQLLQSMSLRTIIGHNLW